MHRQPVAGSRPLAPYSPGIVAEGRFVFVAGQVPMRDGAYEPAPIEEETALALENLLSVLSEAGSGPEHVVRCGVFLSDLAHFPGMNAVYAEVFPDPKPARTTVQAALANGMKVEIDCVALVP